MDECARCHAANSFVLLDGRYSCRVCNYEDQRRAEYEMEDANYIDFSKNVNKMLTELKRSVKKSRVRKKGERVGPKNYHPTIPKDQRIPKPPVRMYEKKFRRRIQPGERAPPGDVLPRRHEEVATWKRISHRLSAFTQLLARTTRFLVAERRATENPVAMVIFRRLLASQGIAFSDREWTDVEEDRYALEMLRYLKKDAVVTVEEQRREIETQIATQNEELRTGAGVEEGGMWSMLMSDTVTENLQVAAPALPPGQAGRMKKKRKRMVEPQIVKKETDTSKDALVRGGVLALNVELLVAISFLACSLVGSRVQMADLVRWYREARVPLPPHFLHDLVKIKYADNGRMTQLESCRYERHFNFYLHECNSFLQRVINATRVPRRRISIKLDEVVASHLSHLNLPFTLMERALVVLARARVETVDLSIDRANEEGQYCNENTCMFGLQEGRVHPMLSTAYRAPFVTFSSDTRAMAVILLVLRLTFGLRVDSAFTVKNPSRFFNVGAWLRQLRMRMRVYGGEEGDIVVSESMRESPQDYNVEWHMEMNRVDLVQNHGKMTYRHAPRSSFPEGWLPLPRLDGNRYLYKDGLPFPEDGEATRAIPSRVAMMTPLIFHGERVREELEKAGPLLDKSGEEREAIKLIGASFKEQEIEETSESLLQSTTAMRRERAEEGEVAEEWRHLYPAAVNFEISSLPRLSVTSLVKFNNLEDGRYMIGGGSGDIAFSFMSAAPNLSRPHRFLIQTMSRLIIEAPAVIYAASSMLERRMMRYQSCLSLVQNLESGGPVVVEDCAVPFHKGGELIAARLELTRAAGEARNIIDVECYAKRANRRKREVQTGGGEGARGNEVIQLEDGDETEEVVGDQRAASDGENGSEAEEDSQVEEEREEDDATGNQAHADSMEESGDEAGSMDEEGVEMLGGNEDEEIGEEAGRAEENPCERYHRALDKYRPVVQKKFYLNFEYLWSILAMRMW